MSLSDLVHTTVSTDGAALKQAGFGIALFVDYHTKWPDRVRLYTELSGISGDGFNTYDPLYKMAQAAFSQDPRPEILMLGRLELPYTQTVKWTPTIVTTLGYVQSLTIECEGDTFTAEYTNAPYVAAATILNTGDILNITGHTFRLNDVVTLTTLVGGTGLAVLTDYHVISVVAGVSIQLSATQGGAAVVITLDGTANVNRVPLVAADIIDGMKIAIEALNDFDTLLTVSNQLTYMRIITTAGKVAHYSDWVGNNVTPEKLEDVTANTGSGGIASELDAIQLSNDSWYGFAHAVAAKAIQAPAAAWIEANKKLAVFRTADWQAADSGQTTDIGDVLQALSYARSPCYPSKHSTGDYRDAAALGERFPHDPGTGPSAGGTWFGKTLAGVAADDWTPTEKANLRAKNYNVYIETAGRSHTLDGKTPSGEYIDTTRFLDWTNARIAEAVATEELDSDRVPFTDSGISQIGKAVQTVLDIGVQAGGWSNDPYPTVTVPKAKDISKADKSARRLRGLKWAGTLAGAIHLTDVDGTVS